MASTLQDIKEPIEQELDEFEIRFKQAMKSNVALLDKVTGYIVKRKGKQVRPMFVFLKAKIRFMSEIVYVTEESLEKMRQELQHLVAIERPNASKAIAEARSQIVDDEVVDKQRLTRCG